MAEPNPIAPQNAPQPPLQAANTDATPKDAPFDVSWMLRDNRLHIEDGSHFLPNNYLMVHPKELAPENQQKLFAKLVKHLAIPAPSFFEFYPRGPVMFALASYLPVSKEAQMETLKEAMGKLENLPEGGVQPDGQKLMDRYRKPFVADARSRHEEPEIDAASREFMTQAVSLYLIINEALNLKNLPKEPSAYVQNMRSADGVLADITEKLGMNMSDFITLAQQKGLDGIAARLGVPEQTVEEIKSVAAEAAKHHYADNVVMSWDAGRNVPGMQGKDLQEVIGVGLLQRAGSIMQQLRASIDPNAPQPESVKEGEQRVLAMLRELPKPLQEALYYSGLEMGFVSGGNLGQVRPHLRHAGGMNMFVPFEMGSTDGLRQIINSNFDHRGYSRKVLHHEVNHLFFPKQLGEQGIETLENYMLADAKRLRGLRDALDGWYSAEDKDKPAIEKQIDAKFKVGKIGLHEALSRNSVNPISMQRLLDYVDDALKNLDPNEKALTQGYPTPELRAAEIISRFSERQYATLADHPALVGFMSPQLMVGYHDIFLPHIAKQVEQFKAEQQSLPPQLRYIGLPPGAASLPQTQDAAMALSQNAQIDALPANFNTQPQALVESSSIAAHAPAGVSRYLDKIHQMQGEPGDSAPSALSR